MEARGVGFLGAGVTGSCKLTSGRAGSALYHGGSHRPYKINIFNTCVYVFMCAGAHVRSHVWRTEVNLGNRPWEHCFSRFDHLVG